jgi:hypothetical protein
MCLCFSHILHSEVDLLQGGHCTRFYHKCNRCIRFKWKETPITRHGNSSFSCHINFSPFGNHYTWHWQRKRSLCPHISSLIKKCTRMKHKQLNTFCSFLIVSCGAIKLSPFVTSATICSIVWWMMSAVGGMSGKGNRSTRRKPAPVQ